MLNVNRGSNIRLMKNTNKSPFEKKWEAELKELESVILADRLLKESLNRKFAHNLILKVTNFVGWTAGVLLVITVLLNV